MNGGPFTGTGWTEHRAWLQAARLSDPVVVTTERARAIVDACQHSGSFGPWVDNIDRVTTQGEHRYLHDFWGTMPGDRSFTDALLHIANPPIPQP